MPAAVRAVESLVEVEAVTVNFPEFNDTIGADVTLRSTEFIFPIEATLTVASWPITKLLLSVPVTVYSIEEAKRFTEVICTVIGTLRVRIGRTDSKVDPVLQLVQMFDLSGPADDVVSGITKPFEAEMSLFRTEFTSATFDARTVEDCAYPTVCIVTVRSLVTPTARIAVITSDSTNSTKVKPASVF